MSDWKVDPKDVDEHIERDQEVDDDIMTWDNLLNSGELEGYDEMYINHIDAETAAEIPCENCGGQCIGKGRKDRHGSYRCFSECQKCGRVFEF